jgi:hypothetical protein
MSATVKLSSKLPGEIDINGVDYLVDDLVKDPEAIRVGVVFFDVVKVTSDIDSGADIPTIRVRRLEPIGTTEDAPKSIRDLVDQAVEKRTGRKALPFDQVEVLDDDPLDEGM